MTMAQILADTARRHGLEPETLKGRLRRAWIDAIRQEAMWLMRTDGRRSFSKIGRFMDGRHYATIKNGCRRHEQRMAEG